jgi:hypothetical protein
MQSVSRAQFLIAQRTDEVSHKTAGVRPERWALIGQKPTSTHSVRSRSHAQKQIGPHLRGRVVSLESRSARFAARESGSGEIETTGLGALVMRWHAVRRGGGCCAMVADPSSPLHLRDRFDQG